MSPEPGRITRDDIEAKFRELTGEVSDEVESARSQAVTVGSGPGGGPGGGGVPHRPAERPAPVGRRRGPADLSRWTPCCTTSR